MLNDRQGRKYYGSGVWDAKDKSIIYAIAWDPSGSDLLAYSTSHGNICLCDTKRSRLVYRLKTPEGRIHRLAWSEKQPSVLLSGHMNGYAYIWNFLVGLFL